MNGLPYYKAYPRDFIEGTIGMPFEIKCAYRVVLDLIYMQGGDLPDDARYISGLLGCSIRKWKSIRETLIAADKLQVSGEFLTNYRAEKELETLAKLQDNQREKASKPRKNKGLQKPRQSQPEPEPDTELEGKPSNIERPGRDEFDAVWSIYPKKVEKKAAKVEWTKARRKASFAEIAEPLAEFCRLRNGQDHQFTISLGRWLRGERWTDDQTHAANRARTSTDDLESLSRIPGDSAADLENLFSPKLRIVSQ